jgi:hypothetical protein
MGTQIVTFLQQDEAGVKQLQERCHNFWPVRAGIASYQYYT